MSVIVSKLTQQLAAREVLALGRYRAAQTHSDVCFVQSHEFTHAHTHVAVAVSNAVDVWPLHVRSPAAYVLSTKPILCTLSRELPTSGRLHDAIALSRRV